MVLGDKKPEDVDGSKEVTEASDAGVEGEVVTKNPDVIYQTDEIEVYTVFPSSVMNTDADSEFVENLASVEFKNISGSYLKKCEIQAETADGELFSFYAEDIPADMEVMAFDTMNKSIAEKMEVVNFTCSTEIETADILMKDKIEVETEGIGIKLKNISDTDLSDLVVTCHWVMDDVSYGGSKYEYPVEMLKVGETATIEAADCYLGQVKVVRISANEKE